MKQLDRGTRFRDSLKIRRVTAALAAAAAAVGGLVATTLLRAPLVTILLVGLLLLCPLLTWVPFRSRDGERDPDDREVPR